MLALACPKGDGKMSSQVVTKPGEATEAVSWGHWRGLQALDRSRVHECSQGSGSGAAAAQAWLSGCMCWLRSLIL